MTTNPIYCERCGEELNPSRAVWLELNMDTGVYHKEGTVPQEQSQGCFTFGAACARRELKVAMIRAALAKAGA